jgi:ArsR family transcriptional regulator
MMSNYKTIDPDTLARQFKALSNPHRLRIFNLLSGCCEPGNQHNTEEILSCCVGELDQQLGIASSTLSHHLRELHHASLIEMKRRGKQIYCSVNTETLTQLKHFFGNAPTQQYNPTGEP